MSAAPIVAGTSAICERQAGMRRYCGAEKSARVFVLRSDMSLCAVYFVLEARSGTRVL